MGNHSSLLVAGLLCSLLMWPTWGLVITGVVCAKGYCLQMWREGSDFSMLTFIVTFSNRIVMVMRKCCLLRRIRWTISRPGVCRLLTAPGALIDCSHWIWSHGCLWQNPLLVWTEMRGMNGSVAALWRRYWPDSGQIRNEMDWFPSPAKINPTVMTSLNWRKDKIFLGITFLSLWLETLEPTFFSISASFLCVLSIQFDKSDHDKC